MCILQNSASLSHVLSIVMGFDSHTSGFSHHHFLCSSHHLILPLSTLTGVAFTLLHDPRGSRSPYQAPLQGPQVEVLVGLSLTLFDPHLLSKGKDKIPCPILPCRSCDLSTSNSLLAKSFHLETSTTICVNVNSRPVFVFESLF